MGLLQEKLAKYDLPQKFMAQGVYPYFREIEGKQGTEVGFLHLLKTTFHAAQFGFHFQ